ncbi:MAG: MATE family efflux transporter [Roseburia sp.]|nr:MATE family efflux transporter [Roseburia sp.]MCM1279095.1 MATE family efflux transporter [Robinsoniella sp.]
MERENQQYIKMTETKIPKLIISLAIPTIISMLITSVYNMADTFFVSRLGASASGAIGIVFSLMAIIQAVGFTLGMGSGSTISRLLGQQKKEEAEAIASSGFLASIVFGGLLLVEGLYYLEKLMSLLGSTDTILPYACEYGRYILLAAPIMSASFVLNNLLRAEGKAGLAMFGITTGGILNIILDPIFIFGLKLGISGAAIATALSQCVSFGILLSHYLRKKTILKLHIKNASRKPETYFMIIKNGLPSFCRQGLASVSTVALNINAAVYGDAAVAAMSIVGKIFMMIFSMVIGFGQGYQPVVGYNYGAKKYDRVKEAFFFTLKVGIGIMASLGLLGFLLAKTVMRWFIADPEVISIGVRAFRAQCMVMPLMPLGVVCNMTFQSIGKAWTATFLSSTRQGIFFLPFIITFPKIMGMTGVEITQPAADLCNFFCCLPFAILFLKNLYKERRKKADEPADSDCG